MFTLNTLNDFFYRKTRFVSISNYINSHEMRLLWNIIGWVSKASVILLLRDEEKKFVSVWRNLASTPFSSGQHLDRYEIMHTGMINLGRVFQWAKLPLNRFKTILNI